MIWFLLRLIFKCNFRSVERNWDRNQKTCKNKSDWSRGIEEESWQPESLSLTTGFFLFLFNLSKKKGSTNRILKNQKFLKNLEIFYRIICKTNFYNMRCTLMITNVFKNSFPSKIFFFVKPRTNFITQFLPHTPKKY